MEVKAYYSNIHKVIIEKLECTNTQIIVAVAWFTDRDIFDVLCKKAQHGVKISVVLVDDEINQGIGRLNFIRLKNLGGEVTFLPAGSQDMPLMHHKFCVLDGKTVITGSYNWSEKTRSNDENITIIHNSAEITRKYLNVFDELCARVTQKTSGFVNTESVKRRLEMIRNLILLEEYEEIATQISKLQSAAIEFELNPIINQLNAGNFKDAIEHIGIYLNIFTALVPIENQEIPLLQFQLQVLELRLESLSNEKAEIERCLIVFNQRHDEALGDLIQTLLKFRAEKALLISQKKTNQAERKFAESEAQDAENSYKHYSEQHEQIQKEAPVPELDKEEEKELKDLYRKACSLCHPDKVTDDKKQDAHDVFIHLQNTYKSNDLKQLKQIYEIVKSGNFSKTRATTLSTGDVLKAAISEIKYKINKSLQELHALQHSQAIHLMSSAGKSEVEWQKYFESQHVLLENEIEKMKTQIQQLANFITDGVE